MILGNSKKNIQALKEKTDHALKGDSFNPIELEEDELLAAIGKNFNDLGIRLNQVGKEMKKIEDQEAVIRDLKYRIAECQSSEVHMSVIGELGQKITTKLSLPEIFETLCSIVSSMMDAPLLLLGISGKKGQMKFFRSPDFPQKPRTQNTVSEVDVAEWSLANGMDVLLNDAENEHARYFFDRIVSLDDIPAQSVLCIPTDAEARSTGVLCVLSYRKNAYNAYHQNMIRSLMAYVSVAVDNAGVYEELKATQAQLVQSEKMASLGQLTAGVAHEINNPINFVSAGIESLKINYLELRRLLDAYMTLKPDGDNADKLLAIEKIKKDLDIHELIHETEDLYQSIKNGAARTAEIVKNLKSFTRLDEDTFKLANLEQGLDSTLIILHSQLKDRIEVIKNYGHIAPVNCYPGQINQVFINILNNAAQAIEGKGTIWITTSATNGYAEISIRDSGSGMSEEVKNRIFDPFFTTKDVGVGTGLGLSISYGIIQKHHGQILVDSMPGQGTTFIIKIPLNLK